MSAIAITVDSLSKRYLVGHQTARTDHDSSFRYMIAHEARNFTRKAVDFVCGRQIVQGDEIEEFWALKDVSFEIKRGEAVGIIGRNGAGKSTLLKILSRITEPSEGRVTITGRIASLLEVGTGFHHELTGRENIYLNGAILGMKQTEIKRKFDEIVAFAEVEKFLDTPVKRYSSGMYVRLAFAVAAHLEPEILVVDEVLSVGDIDFQKKCLGKMEEVAGHGRTVLMVSHNTHAVRSLCSSAITLDAGRMLYFGDPDKAIQLYSGASSEASVVALHDRPRPFTRDSRVQLLAIHLDEEQVATTDLPLSIGIDIQVWEPITVVLGVLFLHRSGERILNSDSEYSGSPPFDFTPGTHRINCTFQSLPLAPGDYVLALDCRSPGLSWYDAVSEACTLEVLPPKDAPPALLQKWSSCLARSDWARASAEVVGS